MRLLVASSRGLLSVDPTGGGAEAVEGPRRPGCLAADPWTAGRVWCGADDDGVHRSDDGGRTWRGVGLPGERVTALAASPARDGLVWAGTEPSAVWRSDDGGRAWRRLEGLTDLPSSSEWAFPPRPETHHVRWIATHPRRPGRLWVAVEAGALVGTPDGGATWRDRIPDGPYDTHELAVHPDAPETLHVAAGDGFYRSRDGGATWSSPDEGLEVGYLRSVAVDPGDPGVVVLSGATGPRSAYVAGRSDGRVWRREGDAAWERVGAGWPADPATVAPVLRPGVDSGELWAADERGVHRSDDGGRTWRRVAPFEPTPSNVRDLALTAAVS